MKGEEGLSRRGGVRVEGGFVIVSRVITNIITHKGNLNF